MGAGERLDLGWGQVVVGAVLGEGGMGVVYRSWLFYHPSGPLAGRPPVEVALKVLHPELSGSEPVRRMFLGEAHALSRLDHPNIVRFLGGYDVPPRLAIVVELIDGEPLSSVIERHVGRARPGGLPAMPFARAWHYFQQLLGALAATHALGIVHRDIKPANVLVRRDGVVKLTDFGIAQLPASQHLDSDLLPGTGAYMAPEQVLGRTVDGRTDLYAAAIVLYEMLAGVTPFDRPELSELAVRAAQIEQTAAPLTSRVPQAPAVIDALFARALDKEPSARFATAIELGDAFRRALGLPRSAGWTAQQALAANAPAIAPRKGRGGTLKLPEASADALRAAVTEAYLDR